MVPQNILYRLLLCFLWPWSCWAVNLLVLLLSLSTMQCAIMQEIFLPRKDISSYHLKNTQYAALLYVEQNMSPQFIWKLILVCALVLAVANIGRLSTKDAVLFLCDMQEKFRPNIFQFPNIVSNAARLLQVGYIHHSCTSYQSPSTILRDQFKRVCSVLWLTGQPHSEHPPHFDRAVP